MEYAFNSDVKRNDVLTRATRMKPEDIMLSERSQSQRPDTV